MKTFSLSYLNLLQIYLGPLESIKNIGFWSSISGCSVHASYWLSLCMHLRLVCACIFCWCGVRVGLYVYLRGVYCLFSYFLPQKFFLRLFATTQLNSTQSWVGLIFLCRTTTTTVRHFFSAPTQPNSTKFRMQPCFNPTRRFMPKKWSMPPPPPKKKNEK